MKYALGIYRAKEGAPFLGADDEAVGEALREIAGKTIGESVSKEAPSAGTAVRRVATVTIALVDDEDVFRVAEPPPPDESMAKADRARETTLGILKRGVRLMRSDQIAKADPASTPSPQEERFVLGLVLEPNDGASGPYKPDTQNDIYSAETIRKAAHEWMEERGEVDLNHSWKALGKQSVRVLESYLAPADFDLGEGEDVYHVVKGTWLLALRIADDGLWQQVKSGKIGAFSIGGVATRTPTGTPAAEE